MIYIGFNGGPAGEYVKMGLTCHCHPIYGVSCVVPCGGRAAGCCIRFYASKSNGCWLRTGRPGIHMYMVGRFSGLPSGPCSWPGGWNRGCHAGTGVGVLSCGCYCTREDCTDAWILNLDTRRGDGQNAVMPRLARTVAVGSAHHITQRAPVAGAFSFVCAGYAAFLADDEVCRAESGAGEALSEALAVCVVQCGGACG